MMETVLFAFGGALLRKIYKFFKQKQEFTRDFDYEKETLQQINSDIEIKPENHIWQSNTTLANIANFITYTTRTIISYCLLFLIFVAVYMIFKGGQLTEMQHQLFNILLTTVLPSLLGYWFIAVPWERMGSGVQNIIYKITKK